MPHCLSISVVDDATVVKLRVKRLDDLNVWGVEEELERLTANQEYPQLRVDLGEVEQLTSLSIGKFVALHKRLRARGGRLSLINVCPRLYRFFERTHLTKILDVHQKEVEGEAPA
jgi:anti-anti-sigma factor